VRRRGVLLFGFFWSLVLGLDQWTKFLIRSHWAPGESRPLGIPGIDLTYHTNTGAAFGLAKDFAPALTVFSLLFLIFTGLWLVRCGRRSGTPRTLVAGVCLITAGAAGNFIDRLCFGHVTDFIDLGFWPIFNMADSAITLGAFLVLGDVFLGRGGAR